MKIALCTPSLDGKVQDEYAKSFGQTISAGAGKPHTLMHIPCRGITLVHDARNYLVAQALASGADRVFFIDADMSWRPQDFWRLAESDEPLIGGLYQQRTRQWNAPLQMVGKYAEFPPVIGEDGLIRMRGIGTGFLCIAREVFEAMVAHDKTLPNPYMAPLYLPKVEALKAPGAAAWNHNRAYFNFSWLMLAREDLDAEVQAILTSIGYPEEQWIRLMCGEDFTFCNKAQDLGFKLKADPDCELVHWDGTVAHPIAFRDIRYDPDNPDRVQVRQRTFAGAA